MSVAAKLHTIFLLSLCITLGACTSNDDESANGGNGGNSESDNPEEPEEVAEEGAPTVTVDSTLRKLRLAWDIQDGDEYYLVSEDPDGGSGFTELDNIEVDPEATPEFTRDVSVHHYKWHDAGYVVEACDATDECIPSLRVSPEPGMLGAIGYFKASNPGVEEEFGNDVALSGDGLTLAVGAHDEHSSAEGINPEEHDDALENNGAVYVFSLGEDGWVQEAYIKSHNNDNGDDFGHSVSLSDDGNTLAVGATWKNSAEPGGAHSIGEVYIYTREAGEWTLESSMHASNARTASRFGVSVDLSDDGNVLAVGSPGETSNATGVNSDQNDTSFEEAGAAYLFTRTDGEWAQTTYLKASNTDSFDLFGFDVALSGDGNTLAVGAYHEGSAATEVDGDQSDNSLADAETGKGSAGAVYVFGNGESGWAQQAYIKSSQTRAGNQFGYDLAISDNGDLLAVGARNEDANSGAVYVFSRAENVWTEEARLKASNADEGDRFGHNLEMNSDGSVLAVGANWEDSTAVGINGNESPNTAPNSGAVYVFGRAEGEWTQTAYVKAPSIIEQAHFGSSVGLDASGDLLAVGAIWEDGASSGVGGDQTDLTVENSGAVYLY